MFITILQSQYLNSFPEKESEDQRGQRIAQTLTVGKKGNWNLNTEH